MPLGTISSFPYQLKNIDLESGDFILLLSDGFPELKNEKQEMLGYSRTKEELLKISKFSPEEMITHLKKIGSDWVNGNDPEDDVTFVLIKAK